MSPTFISLSSISMDLERVAMGYHRGSMAMANRFLEEAMKRRREIDQRKLKPYLRKILTNLDKLIFQDDREKIAEDALMYSVLLQNAVLLK